MKLLAILRLGIGADHRRRLSLPFCRRTSCLAVRRVRRQVGSFPATCFGQHRLYEQDRVRGAREECLRGRENSSRGMGPEIPRLLRAPAADCPALARLPQRLNQLRSITTGSGFAGAL